MKPSFRLLSQLQSIAAFCPVINNINSFMREAYGDVCEQLAQSRQITTVFNVDGTKIRFLGFSDLI